MDEKIDHLNYKGVTSKWFAIIPVRLEEGGWVWMKWVEKEVDDRPVEYLGLLPDITYINIKCE
jgi:hypothetical protein